MDATEVMEKLNYVNNQFPVGVQKPPSVKSLTDCGWEQTDGNGLFFRSPKNDNKYAVDMNIPNNPHLELMHGYSRIKSLDGIPEDDLEYIHGKLEEVEIWLMS